MSKFARLAPTACECAMVVEQSITQPGFAVSTNKVANCCSAIMYAALNLL
jgi:hypothetical protein